MQRPHSEVTTCRRRTTRTIALRVLAAISVVAANGAVSVLPAKAASFTVSVTPNTGLVDGQVVTATVTGFSGSTLAVAECTAQGAATANTADCTAIALGSASTSITLQQQILTSDAGLVDCGAAPGECVVAAADISHITPSEIATAPLTFAATAPPTMRVSATTRLLEGQTVTVAARGFAPGEPANVQECGPTATPAQCDTSGAVTTTTDANGAFAVHFVVHRFLPTPSGTVDCGFVACAITAPPAVTESVALQFPVPNTVVTVTPHSGLVDGQTVKVDVSGHVNAIAECLAPFDLSGCVGITFISQFPTQFTVRRFITRNDTSVDCAARAGTCEIVAADSGDIPDTLGTAPLSFATSTNGYVQRNWISDEAGVAMVRDLNLVNAWGIAAGPSTPLWVSDNGSNRSTLYAGGNGTMPPSIVPLVVKIPDGAPTGIVFNPTHDFFVHAGAQKAASLFIFASEHGDVDAWAPSVGTATPPSKKAFRVASVTNGVFKGIALARTTSGNVLYVTDFRHGTVDAFDHSFKRLAMPGAFVDHNIPAGYAPFNIQNLNGRLYVTYAKQDAAKHDDVRGVGHGFVDIYDTGGRLVKRLVSGGRLNSPWGVAFAPRSFGVFAGALLVGNFGDGRITAYNAKTGALLGQLRRTNGKIMEIDGLWGLRVGNGVAGTPETLLFSAGPDDEAHGLVGAVTPG